MRRSGPVLTVGLGQGRALCHFFWNKEGYERVVFSRPHSTLTGSVFLGPLGLGYVFLAFLLFLLFPVTCLNHLG